MDAREEALATTAGPRIVRFTDHEGYEYTTAVEGNVHALKEFWEHYIGRIRATIHIHDKFHLLRGVLRIHWYPYSLQKASDMMGEIRVDDCTLAILWLSTSHRFNWDNVHHDLFARASMHLRASHLPFLLMIECTVFRSLKCQVAEIHNPETCRVMPGARAMYPQISRDMRSSYVLISKTIVTSLLRVQEARLVMRGEQPARSEK